MKILSCNSCRGRKIACDRKQPACTRCNLAGKGCEYRSRKVAKPAGHSRLKSFEVRLRKLESHLVHEETLPCTAIPQTKTQDKVFNSDELDEHEKWKAFNLTRALPVYRPGRSNSSAPKTTEIPEPKTFPQAGLQQELYKHYFQQVHPSAPLVHKSRFFRALDGPPAQAPPLALRYAMWAIAALTSAEYSHVAERLYILARKHAEELEMQGSPEHLSLSHAQCWYLLGSYEACRSYFTRAWLSIGRCVRLAQMMSLHLLDTPRTQTLRSEQSSWIEVEEGRRVFWASYLGDRWASTLSGHPVIIKDDEIYTNLPSSDQSFDLELEVSGIPLRQVGSADKLAFLSPFAASVFTTTLVGRCLDHIRAYEHDSPSDSMADYWQSHRELDTTISLTCMNLPTHLRISPAEKDVHVILTNVNLHLAIILLHQLAIKTANRQKMDHTVRQQSFQRCRMSALEIKDAIYSAKELRIFSNNMWTAFCIYISAGIFISDMTSNANSLTPKSSFDLGLLLIALNEISSTHGDRRFFSKLVEADITRTGVAIYIPKDLQEMAGLKLSGASASSPGVSRKAPYCESPQSKFGLAHTFHHDPFIHQARDT